jgi:peptidylprolyl isomerase
MTRFLAATVFALLAVTAVHAQASADPQNTLVIETTKGRILVKLRPDLAPKHVAQVKTLAKQGFYNGIVFHRVIAGFMAQTGDGGKGDGTGGSKYPNLPAEFSSIPYKRGIVGMARRGDSVNSANSQFFIMYGEAPSLNGQYTVIGEVVEGMAAVDQIKRGAPDSGRVDNPDRITRMQVAADAR